MPGVPLLLLGAAAAAAAASRPSSRGAPGGAPTAGGPGALYASFLQQFDLSLLRAREGPSVRRARRELFERRSAEVEALNSRPGASWRAAVNRFADHTDDELKAHFGFKSGAWRHRVPAAASFLGRRAPAAAPAAGTDLPEEVSWPSRLSSGRRVVYQGMCGSCWAVAATGALETHMEIAHGNASELSYEQILRCTPNPRNCGGPGGCGGATSELAFEYVREHGIDADQFGHGGCEPGGDRARVVVSGFVQLPANQAAPLMEAVASKGPVVVGVDASNWFPYQSGVFSACDENPVIGHAVLLMGYGAVPGGQYWLIRNSWGESWGEGGFIRLFRRGGGGDDSQCGVDSDPQQGVGCDGGPSQVTVCGMCGILADSAYPVGLSVVPARPAGPVVAGGPAGAGGARLS